jgi:hypothetical protein
MLGLDDQSQTMSDSMLAPALMYTSFSSSAKLASSGLGLLGGDFGLESILRKLLRTKLSVNYKFVSIVFVAFLGY